jgi:hypothetical protein
MSSLMGDYTINHFFLNWKQVDLSCPCFLQCWKILVKQEEEDLLKVGGASFELVDLEGYCGSWH